MADPCAHLRNELNALNERIDDLKSQIATASGNLLHGLAQQLNQATRQLPKAKAALSACEVANPPRPVHPGPGVHTPPVHPPLGGGGQAPDKCAGIRAKVDALQAKVDDLRAMIAGATGGVLHGLAGQLSLLLNKLANAQYALDECEGKHPLAIPKPLTVGVEHIHCWRQGETAFWGSDEPYILAVAIDLSSTKGGLIPVPSLNVSRIGPWEDVEDGEIHSVAELDPSSRRPFWDITGGLKMLDPATAIFLIAMMEHDGGKVETVRAALEAAIVASLSANLTLGRDAIAQSLLATMGSLIDEARKIGVGSGLGGLDFDDQIGDARELPISPAALTAAYRYGIASEGPLSFGDRDNGYYDVYFTYSAAPLN